MLVLPNSNIVTLFFCVAGIYSSFVSWSFFHERISVTVFGDTKFVAPLFIQLVQSLFASLIGLFYLWTKYNKANKAAGGTQDPKKAELVGKPSFTSYLVEFYSDVPLLKTLLLVSVTQSLSTPVGNSALQHIDFVTYLLAKSCKLIPVLVIHTFLYKKKFPLHKYLIAVLITCGVFLFSYKKPSADSGKGNGAPEGDFKLGMLYLSISLLLDGLTNSTQDQMFRKFPKMTGTHLMVALNTISFCLVLFYSTVLTNQLQYSLEFIKKYPEVFYSNIFWYALCGSIGQIFIFLTLENFDSLVLITINVTRKMVSMLVSLIVFKHPMNLTKFMGISLVFFGIGLESWLKFQKSTPKATKTPEKVKSE